MNIIEIIRFSGRQEDLLSMAKELEVSGDLKLVNEEEGCFYFQFFCPVSNDGLLLLEKWESEEALDNHHETPMMANLLALIKKYSLKLEVEKYTVD